MRRISYVVLALGLFASFGGPAGAADLYPSHRSLRVSQGGYGDRLAPSVPRIRVVEQVPYCGDCDAPVGWGSSRTVRLRYVGYPVWERGCALGGCYGYYDVAPSCYWRDAALPDGRGGWVRGVEQVCDSP
ncbi:MAG TPA: hypothetical protein VIV34_04920 [Pseudolabrys sp.]